MIMIKMIAEAADTINRTYILSSKEGVNAVAIYLTIIEIAEMQIN